MPLTAKQILRAAAVPGKFQRVYSIGSFASRVNFQAQQRRALNLVWALSECGHLSDRPRVAVIGGGLAGVTAAAALIAFGATVDVFEKGGRVLHRQRMTHHRRVHPTINAWPFEKVSLATELPFYDWSVGVCSEVADAIALDFERTMKELDYNIYTGVTARDLATIGTELVRVVTTPALKKSDGYKSEGYDLVLITIGYGDEVVNSDFACKSYWEGDNLETERDASDSFQTFLVSGCGDGGLIDTLRIVYFNFKEGELAFELAARLCGSPLAKAIKSAEQAAALQPETERRKGGKVTKMLASAYAVGARSLRDDPDYKEVRQLLDDGLGDFDKILYLGDKSFSLPYSIKSSPIHKLMIAYITETVGALKFEPNEASTIEGGFVRLGQYKFDLAATKVVIRHGAVPDFKNLVGERDRKTLQTRQWLLKDKCAEPAWPTEYKFPTPPRWTSDLNSPKYTKIRRDMARRAIESIVPDAIVSHRPGKFRVDLEAPPPASAPKMLFRVPVEYEVEADSEAL